MAQRRLDLQKIGFVAVATLVALCIAAAITVRENTTRPSMTVQEFAGAEAALRFAGH